MMRLGKTLAHTHREGDIVRKGREDSAANNGDAYRKKEVVYGICPETYFKNLNVQFTCLGTTMTPKSKFMKLNMQLASSGTYITPVAKFR